MTRNGELAGAVFSLRYKDTMLFKYGASDARFHSLGTMPFLLWQAIEEAKNAGATQFDFGRSEIENRGLISFKNHFGAKQSVLTTQGLSCDFLGCGRKQPEPEIREKILFSIAGWCADSRWEANLPSHRIIRTHLINGFVTGKQQNRYNGNRRKLMISQSSDSFTS